MNNLSSCKIWGIWIFRLRFLRFPLYWLIIYWYHVSLYSIMLEVTKHYMKYIYLRLLYLIKHDLVLCIVCQDFEMYCINGRKWKSISKHLSCFGRHGLTNLSRKKKRIYCLKMNSLSCGGRDSSIWKSEAKWYELHFDSCSS